MTENIINSEKREKNFYRFIIKEYLKYGSVDEIFRKNDYNLPISYPGVHRLIDRWGIIKTAGPNSKLSEALTFLVLLTDKKLSVEKVYKALPPSFKTSLATMHRIMHNVKEGIVRRVGTALVITAEDNPTNILIGEDISTPRIEFGKPFGSLSLPMGFSKKSEKPMESILRVIQQEVFTNDTIEKKIPEGLMPENSKPFMYLDIADVRVAVYHLKFSNKLGNLSNFSSFKLKNFHFIKAEELANDNNIIKANLRMGMREIGLGYLNYLKELRKGDTYEPIYLKSLINLKLSDFAFGVVQE